MAGRGSGVRVPSAPPTRKDRTHSCPVLLSSLGAGLGQAAARPAAALEHPAVGALVAGRHRVQAEVLADPPAAVRGLQPLAVLDGPGQLFRSLDDETRASVRDD